MLYETVIGKFIGFVKVTLGELAFKQTDAVPLILTEGVGRTVIFTGLADTEQPLDVAVIV